MTGITFDLADNGKAIVRYFGAVLFHFNNLKAAVQWVEEWTCYEQTF